MLDIAQPALVTPKNKLRLRNAATAHMIQVTPSASANTKGSYAELITSIANKCVWVRITLYWNPTTARRVLVDIATGGGGSESVLIPNLAAGVSGSGHLHVPTYQFPCKIAAGTRLSARAQGNAASSEAVYVTITVFDGNSHEVDGGVAFDAIGVDTATTSLTAHTPGNSGSKSAYTQITASSSNRYKGVFGAFQNTAAGNFNTGKLDLATGAAASEVIFIPDNLFVAWDVYTRGDVIPYTPMVFNSATRFACRSSESGTASAKAVALYGVR